MKKKTHLIGNSHIDPVWQWRWQDGMSEIKAIFKSVLDRMNEFPDFKFTCAGSMYYEWIEKSDPKMFAEIAKRIKEGRWCVAGGWYLQPDCNIPSGESFARHGFVVADFYNPFTGKSIHPVIEIKKEDFRVISGSVADQKHVKEFKDLFRK